MNGATVKKVKTLGGLSLFTDEAKRSRRIGTVPEDYGT